MSGNTELFIKSHPKGHYMQSELWAKVKDNWAHEVVTVEGENGEIKGMMSLLIRKVPFFPAKLIYSPRGPVCDVHDKETLRALTQKAKEVAKRVGGYVLKIDPDVKAKDEEFASIMKELGYRLPKQSKNFEGIQPRFVFRLDIGDKSEEELLNFFHSKTRYNIRLAERKGVVTRVGTKEDYADFHRIMVETGTRDEFVVRSQEYFEKMAEALTDEHCRLFMADYEGQPIAGTLAIAFGNKCWYLYGASSNAHRNVMPNYALQWDMIRWAKEKGCEIYDFRGVSGDLDESNPLYGLYKFKKGFNGEFTEFIGELNYVFNPFMNFLVEHGEKAFRELRRKLYLLKGQK